MPTHRRDTSRGTFLTPRVRRQAVGLLERWTFRRKLNVLVIVPLAAITAMLVYVVYSQVAQAQSAAATARLVHNSEQVAELIDGLQNEHREALLVSLHYEAGITEATSPTTQAYRQSQKSVDARARLVTEAFGGELPDAEAQALKEIGGLSTLRETVAAGPLPADNIDPAYNAAVADLIDGLGLGVSSDRSATTPANLLDALLRADTAHASFETSVFAARTGDPNALIEFTGAVGDYAVYTYQAKRFTRYASPAQAEQLADVERSIAENTIGQHYAALQVDPGALVAERQSLVQDALSEALSAEPLYQRQADHRLAITGSLINEIADQAAHTSNAAWVRAISLLGAAALGFVLWLTFSVLARRSVIRPVQALTAAARSVADLADLELSRVADDDSVDTAPPRLEAVPVNVRDEIGELAEAFNQVQATATALLERQVVGRRNIAEMFGNVGRRVSNLTVRQLALIDAVERGESSPDVLERLYRIDHLAVRLQRNAESLLLLAGIQDSSAETEPTALTDVVRAALGQIEDYQRVAPRAETDVTVVPDIVGDLTLMLAELLENAVSFSPSGTRVEVLLRAFPESGAANGAQIEIIDHGLGMPQGRIDEENARLVRRERLDLVPTKVLGLFVVGGLSRRWGINVHLANTLGGGTSATVRIPSSLLLATHHTPPPGRRPLSAVPENAGGTGPQGRPDPETGLLPQRLPQSFGPCPSSSEAPLPGQAGHHLPRRSAPAPTPPAAPSPTPMSPSAPAPEVRGTRRDAPRQAPHEGRPPQQSTDLFGVTRGTPGTPPQDMGQRRGGHPQGPPPGTGQHPDTGGHPVPEQRPAAPRQAPHDPRPPQDANLPGWARNRPVPLTQDAPPVEPGGVPPLPRRVSQRADDIAQSPTSPAAAEQPTPDGARPLRRRVRGATLRSSGPDGTDPRPAERTWRPSDAHEAREELDEFEEAVARAHRDSASAAGREETYPMTGTAPTARRSEGRLSDHVDR